VLVRNEPPPLLFIGQSTGARRSETPWGWPLGPMDKQHVEALDQPTPRSVQSILGSADPRWAPLIGVLPWGGCPVGP
jgi:hypothetical protein